MAVFVSCPPWLHTCHTVFAHMHVFVHLSVPVYSVLAGLPPLHCDCSSKPCSQATLSLGNASEVHQGETLTRREGRENRRKKKGQDTPVPPRALLPFGLFSARLYIYSQKNLSSPFKIYSLAASWKTACSNTSQAAKVSISVACSSVSLCQLCHPALYRYRTAVTL